MWKPRGAVPALTLFAAAVACAEPAGADDTIKRPGDHPDYAVEIEPHGLWGWNHYDYALGDGFGLGARFSIPIVDNGFVSSINDSVAIGFGLDWVHYSANSCYNYYYNGRGPYPGCYYVGDANYLFFPVVMQWNFFVAKSWSVFAEPGLSIYHGWFNDCANLPPGYGCPNPTQTGVDFAFYLGGRYHFNEHVALTMRVGYPTVSIGVSFM